MTGSGVIPAGCRNLSSPSVGLSQSAIVRVVASLVAAERANGGSGRVWESAGWRPSTLVGPDDLGLDSLELIAASNVVNRFFRLHETGDENRLLSEN